MTAYNPHEARLHKEMNIDSPARKEKIALEKAHARASEILRKDEIKPSDFRDLYDPKMIKKDLEYVEMMEQRFLTEQDPKREESKQYAEILEAIIHDNIEKSNWLGRDAHSIKSSRYDDIKNGVDMIVEFQDEDEAVSSRLALVVDITFSTQIREKIDRIKEDIRNGRMAEVKYFSSDLSNQRGELVKLPNVVIGAEIGNVKKVRDAWMNESGNGLERHPLQMLMLEEIQKQLIFFMNYAIEYRQDEVAKSYKQALSIVFRILKEKVREEGLSAGVWEDDKVFKAIKDQLKMDDKY